MTARSALPNFQRDFVWTREEVADLVRSIVRGYFIGSLLLLRCDRQQSTVRSRVPSGCRTRRREPRPELLILDGQQRLSSLIYALTAPDLSLKDSSQRRWFFVNLDVLLSEPDSDEVVFDRAKRELRGLDTAEAQYEQRMLPCTVLLTQQRFYHVARRLRGLASPEGIRTSSIDYRAEWRDGWTSAVTAFRHSKFRSSSCPASTTPTASRSVAFAQSSRSSTRRASIFRSTTC